MIHHQTIAIPITNHERIRYWIWYRLSRLIAVYNVWPLPGFVHVATDDLKKDNHVSNEFCWFMLKFLSRDLGRLCSTRTSPFVMYAEAAGLFEKNGYILDRVIDNKSPEPAHVAIATYAFAVGKWFSDRLPPENMWPDQLVDWAEVIGEMFGSDMPTNPWEMTWLDCPATNANDLLLFLCATGSHDSVPTMEVPRTQLKEIDPNDEPPDIYGYLGAVVVKGQGITPPLANEQSIDSPSESKANFEQWMLRLCSVVDDF